MLRNRFVKILPLDNSSTVNYLSGINADIISVIHSNVARAARQTREISKYFKGSTDLDTARNIWNFLKKEIKYKRDREGFQDVALPGRFVAEGLTRGFDCKSFSLFTAAILENLKIPYSFRYASYSATDPTPQHVYVVTDSGIIIDGVWNAFNSEKAYKHKKDYHMRISTLSGIGCNDCQPKALSGTVMIGDIGKISLKKAGANIQSKLKNTKVVKAASKIQNQVKKTAVVKTASKVQNKIKSTGVVKAAAKIQNQIKKVGAKAVIGAAPRRAYRTLVAVNFRGWATKLAANPTEARRIWEKAGGTYSELEKSIRTGVNKKALFGSKTQQIRTVDGIGEPVTLATIGAFIATATPIILLFANLTKDKGGATESTSTDPTDSSESSPVEDIINSVANIFSTGKQTTDTSAPQNQTSNTDEIAPVTNSSSSGLMLLAVGVGAYLLLK